METKVYNYKNCQSLFGYSAQVHIRCKGKCQLCGCGGEPLDFDLWRQMTVEHLIGKSQGGYLKQIKESLRLKFKHYGEAELEALSDKVDALNTVTACQFCNSTTSRDISSTSMIDIISGSEDEFELLAQVSEVCNAILKAKQTKVAWKLESIREAFEEKIQPKIEN